MNENIRNKLNAGLVIYYLPSLLVLVTACIMPQEWPCSFAFIFGCLCIFMCTKKYTSIINFCIICLINRQIVTAPLYYGADITLMALINIIVMFFLAVELFTRFTIKNKYFAVPILYLFIWILYRAVNASLTGTNSFISGIWTSAPIMFSILLQVLTDKYNKYGKELYKSIIIGGSLVVFTGYVELILNHTFFYSLWKDKVYRYGILRVGSTLADPNFMAMVDLAILFLLFTTPCIEIFGKKFVNIFKTLIIIQIILSFSRTAIITLTACFMLAFFCRKKGRLIYLAPLVVIVTALIVPSILDIILRWGESKTMTSTTSRFLEIILQWGDSRMLTSTSSRLQVVKAAFNLWIQSPVFGVGNGGFYLNSSALVGTENVNTMNTFLQVAVEYGIVGLFFYLCYCFFIVRECFIIFWKSGNSFIGKSFGWIAVSLLGWLLMSMSLDTFQLIIFWIFPAIIMINKRYIVTET